MNRILLTIMLVMSSLLVGAGCEGGHRYRSERWDRDRYQERHDGDRDRDWDRDRDGRLHEYRYND
jgi:hypothetical protein